MYILDQKVEGVERLSEIGAQRPGEALKSIKGKWIFIRFIFPYNKYLLGAYSEGRKIT